MASKAIMRKPTQEELAFHSIYLEQFTKRLDEAMNESTPTNFLKLMGEANSMARRHGWAGSSNNLMIDEAIVFNDIAEKNPQPDPLEQASQEQLATSFQAAKDVLMKFTNGKGVKDGQQ